MSTSDTMTPELWQKLTEMSDQPDGVMIDYNETTPAWISSLSNMGYLDYQNWGAGGRFDKYTISKDGQQALLQYKFK